MDFSNVKNADFRKYYKYCNDNQDKIPNYMEEMHEYAEKYPNRICKATRQRIEIENKFKTKYRFDNVLCVTIVMWLQKNVKLVDGPNTGKPFRVSMAQKWIVTQVFGWYQEIDIDGILTEERLTKDLLIMVGSGFGKSTFLSALNHLFLNVDEIFGDTKIFNGANAQQQANLVFETTHEMIKASKYKGDFNFRPSSNEIQHKKERTIIRSMSSKGDNYEGIIPSVVIIDEIHAMKTAKYVDNLRKNRNKRRDMLVFEITTQGDVRGGYLDTKLEYARKVLAQEVEDDEKCFIIFENESIEEVINAYENNEVDVLYKSNPNLGVSQNSITLFSLIKDMINDPSKRTVTLTKNFNIPQNAEQSFFSASECKTLEFDESIFYCKNVFLGLDVAETRSYQNDFTCLDLCYYNPNTDKYYRKKWYFMPKWYEDKNQEKHLMVPDKSSYDNIDYQKFIDRGDIILVEDTYIKQDYINNFISEIMNKYKVNVLKFGLDPAFADKISTYWNALAQDPRFCLEYRSNKREWTQKPINITKQSRSEKKVYENNKFTEVNFACATATRDSNDNVLITNPSKTRKDGVSAELACNSAINIWLNQQKDINGFKFPNIDLLKRECPTNEEEYERGYNE